MSTKATTAAVLNLTEGTIIDLQLNVDLSPVTTKLEEVTLTEHIFPQIEHITKPTVFRLVDANGTMNLIGNQYLKPATGSVEQMVNLLKRNNRHSIVNIINARISYTISWADLKWYKIKS